MKKIYMLPPSTLVYTVGVQRVMCVSDREGSYVEEWGERDLSEL